MSDLPELPPPDVWVREDFGLGDSTVHRGWSEDQMLSFAREAMEIGRRSGLEEAARIAEHLNGWGSKPAPELAHHIAAVIRSMSKTSDTDESN